MTAPETASKWNGVNAGEKPSGIGTADDPVIIASAANLAYWRANDEELYLTAYVELHTDIDLTNHNWGGMIFKGHFDGKGHAIYNLKQTSSGRAGFFSYFGGTVENLKIINASITTSVEYAGIFGGETNGAITVNNCELYNCKVVTKNTCGILVGRNKGYKVTISNVFIDEKCSFFSC